MRATRLVDRPGARLEHRESRVTQRKSKLFRAGRDQRSLEQSALRADDLADVKRPLNGEGQAVHHNSPRERASGALERADD